jgi:hypothetical protein
LLANAGPNQTPLDQLKRMLTGKADMGDARAQLALGRLYESGALAPNGIAQHDYAGAAYWYHLASDRGEAEASYQLANLYRDGLGVPADRSQSFQLLQKAAEAVYVPAMAPLSDAYAEQKTPVSGERATYWAMKAAEAGDPRGWAVLGFEYETGKLGGNPPYWHQKAMESYRKAADGGNCLAMLAIGDLYAAGNGVRADQAQAQSWRARAQSCQGGNIATLQQQVTEYKARATAARDPALHSLLAALPDSANSPAQAAGNNRGAPTQGRNTDSSGFNQRIIDGLIAGAVIYVALDVAFSLFGPASSSGSDANASPGVLSGMQQSRCAGQGLQGDFSGGGCM